MRDGRRKRLGLLKGTEGTVGDTYLDRILSDEQAALLPGTYNLGEADANVLSTDQRQYSDAYNYLLGGGFPEEATPAVETPPSSGGGDGGGGGQVDIVDQLGPITTDITSDQIDEVALTGGTTGGVTNDNITVENIAQNQTPYDEPMDMSNPGASIENIIAQQNQTIPDDPSIDAVPVKTSTDAQGNMYSMEEDTYGNYIGNINDEFGTDGDVYAGQNLTTDQIPDETLSTSISDIFTSAKDLGLSAIETAQELVDKGIGTYNDLDKTITVPGLGEIDVGKTLGGLALNTIAGAPISLAMYAMQQIPKSQSQIDYDNFSDEKQAAVDEIYGPGGIMENYNAVSTLGEGVDATIQKRIDDFQKNYTAEELAAMSPTGTYNKLLDAKKLTSGTGINPNDQIDIDNQINLDKELDDKKDDIVDVQAVKDNIKKAEKAAADKAAAAKEAEIEANQQRAKEEAARIQAEKNKAAQQQQEDNDRQDRIEAAEKEAAKDPYSGYGSCFIAGTKISMADDTLKNIEDVAVDDMVKGQNGDNKVIALDPTLLANRKLYSFNDNEHYFFTSEHPFMTEEGWKSIKPEKTKERDGIELYDQLKGQLKIGDKLVTENGLTEIKDIKSKEMNSPEMPLYNFHISNDNSYIADTYIVHNKGGDGCFLAGTLVTMADGTNKPVEQVDLKDNVAEGGKVFATGKFLVENLHDYKGIKVSGSHMVNEDDNWVRVEDSKHGKPLGDDEHTVYVFGSENRRILINGILFTDYFETKEQDKLLDNEEDFFKNWKSHGKTVSDENVDALNAV